MLTTKTSKKKTTTPQLLNKIPYAPQTIQNFSPFLPPKNSQTSAASFCSRLFRFTSSRRSRRGLGGSGVPRTCGAASDQRGAEAARAGRSGVNGEILPLTQRKGRFSPGKRWRFRRDFGIPCCCTLQICHKKLSLSSRVSFFLWLVAEISNPARKRCLQATTRTC